MKSLIRISCFLIILFLVLRYCNSVLKFKYADGISSDSAFYELEDNTVDVLILGSSHAFVNFSPDTLWKEYGIASFVMGGSVQPFWNTYYHLKEALKTQTPELIVLEAFAASQDFEYSDDSRIIKNTYGLKWSTNKIESIIASAEKERRKDFFLDYSQYHTRYPTLDKGDFFMDYGSQKVEYNWFGKDWKGQYFFNTSNHIDIPDVSSVDYETPLLPKEEEYYRKILMLAQNKEIPIVVMVAPYSLNEYEQSKYLTAERIADENGVEFINYNLMLDEIGFDYDHDYHDHAHMTAFGAEKFTKYVGSYLKNNYTIADHRGDVKYSSWDRWAEYCNQYRNGERLIETFDKDDLGTQLKNKNYYVFISVDGTCTSSDEGIRQFLNGQGIYDENVNGVWCVREGNVMYGSGVGDFEQYMRNRGRDFCIRHIMESDSNELIIDNELYEKKVDNGINVTVYDDLTNMIIDSFGIDFDDSCIIVR